MTNFKVIIALFVVLLIVGCNQAPDPENEILERTVEGYKDYYQAMAAVHKANPDGWSSAYALMKDGMAGPDWLLTIHGLPDNLSVCEEITAPYNEGQRSSTLPGSYYCVAIDENFSPFAARSTQ